MSEDAATPDVAVPESVETAKKKKKPAGAESWLRDNLEAVAVAIIMALLIRHFCVEAFRIPGFNLDDHTFWELERDAEARSFTGTRTFTTQ